MLSIYLQIIDNQDDKLKFEQIYINYKDVLLNRAFSILNDNALAEDAVHNAFLNIIKRLPKLYEPDSDSTKWYIFVTVENEAKKIYNKEHEVVLTGLTDCASDFDLDKFLDDKNAVRYAKAQIEKLPDIYRGVLSLYYFNELKPKEIAVALSIKQSTVYKRIKRGKALLLKLIEDEFYD